MKIFYIKGHHPPLIKNILFVSFVYLYCAFLVLVQPVVADDVTGTEVIDALMDLNTGNAISFDSGASAVNGFGVIDTKLASFPLEGNSAVIISTGTINSAALDNNSTSTTTELDGLNTDDGQDLTRLEFVLAPPTGKKSISVYWRLMSEEFPENEVSDTFNDTYTIEVGDKVITYDLQNLTLSHLESIGTTYDGATYIYRTIFPFSLTDLNSDGTLTVVFSVFDVGDSTFDTAVLLDKLEWGEETGEIIDFEIPEPIITDLTISPGLLIPLIDSSTANPSAIELSVNTSVEVSTISAVQFTVNGGIPINMTADDGSFDDNFEHVSYSGTLDLLGIVNPGIYSIQVYATSTQAGYTFEGIMENIDLVVYDVSAGSVSGSGQFISPVGAYRDNLSLTGMAHIAFVSKYRRGKSEPDGNTAFRFKAAGLSFQSSTYQWLVVTEYSAKFKGTGVVNIDGQQHICKFMLTGVDNEPDEIRMKLWQEDGFGEESVIYDNSDESSYGSILETGNIMIHEK